MKSPLISIVIPSYNKVKYVEQTLKSIVGQSYKNYEVIIQDGGSNDGTKEILEKYSKKYKNIKLVSKKDGGQLDAINKGIKKAKGDIISFINADDVYEKDALQTVVEYHKENPESLWFAGKGIVVDEKGNEIAKIATNYKNMLLGLNNYNLLLMVNYLMQPSVFLTRKALNKFKKFTGTKDFVMEYDMWLKIGKIKMPVVIKKTLTRFRLEKDTKTSVNSKKLLREDEKIIKKHTGNNLILFLHVFNNYIRYIMQKSL